MAESVSGGSVDGVGGREGKTQMEGERERQRRKEEREECSFTCMH